MPWYAIVGMVITFVAGVWGGFELVKHTLRESAELLVVIAEAIEQKDYSREKLKQIVEEASDVVVAALNVIRK